MYISKSKITCSFQEMILSVRTEHRIRLERPTKYLLLGILEQFFFLSVYIYIYLLLMDKTFFH